MTPEDIKKLAELLPQYPRGMTPIEWIGVATVAILLLVLLVTAFFTIPRALSRASEERAADRESFADQQAAQRKATLSAFADVTKSHERAFERMHDRLDKIDGSVQATRREVIRLDCYRNHPDEVSPMRRKDDRPGGGGVARATGSG